MQSGRRKIRLLLVDEQDGFFELLRRSADIWNERFEFECQQVESASDAIHELAAFQPSIVLCDVHMDGMSCMQFVEQIAQRRIPVVVTASEQFHDLRGELRRRGAVDCIAKSEDPDAIALLLEELAEVAEDFELAH